MQEVNFDDLVPGNPGGAAPSEGFYIEPGGNVRPPGAPPQASVPNQLDYSKFGQSKYTDEVQAVKGLTDGYMGDERTKSLVLSMPNYLSGLQTAPDGGGDQALVYAFAKVMDPMGAVQQGESKGIREIDTLYGQLVAKWNKELQQQGGDFRPEVRQQLRREMTTKIDGYIAAHNQAREFYADKAKYFNVPPEVVVGKENLGAAYSGQIRALAVKKREAAIREKGLNPAEHQDWIQNGPDELRQPPGPGGPGQLGPGESISNALQMDKPQLALPPEQAAIYNAWAKLHPNPTPEQHVAFFRDVLNMDLDPARAAEIAAAQAKGAMLAPGEQAVTPTQLQEQKDAEAQRIADEARAKALLARQDKSSKLMLDATGGMMGGAAATGDKERLLMHGAMFNLDDEAAGIANAFTNPLAPLEGYRAGRDAEQMRIEKAREAMGWGGTALEIGGNILSLNPGSAVANLTARAAAAQAAKAGGATSALAGWGEGRGAKESLGNAAIYGTTGAVIAPAIPELARAGVAGLKRLGNSPLVAPFRGQAPELAAASRALDTPIQQPMFDPALRKQYGHLESATGSSETVRGRVGDTVNALERGKVQLQGPGTVEESGAAGTIIQRGAQRWIDRTRAAATRLYDRAQSLVPQGALITPRKILNAIRVERQRLMHAPNTRAGELEFLDEIAADLTSGPLTVEGFRAVREGFRSRIDQKELTSSQAEAAAMRILAAAREDISDSLGSAAGRAFRRADTFYAERMGHIEDVLEGFIGQNKAGMPRLSGEQALNKLVAMAHPKTGDARRFGAVWRGMTNGEQDDILASIIGTMGRPLNQPQAPFSPALFKQAMAKISPEVRRVMFGQRGVQSIDNLLRLEMALEGSASQFNPTKSGTVIKQGIMGPAASMVGAGAAAATATGGSPMVGIAAAAGGFGVALLGAIKRNLQARWMTNPTISRFFAELPGATTPTQLSDRISRLSVIMAREPALRDELAGFKAELEALAGSAPKDKSLKPEDTE